MRRRSSVRHVVAVLSAGLLLAGALPAVSAAEPTRGGRLRPLRGAELQVDKVQSVETDKFVPRAHSRMSSIIIKLNVAPVASYRGGVNGLSATEGLVAADRTDSAAKQTISRYEAHVASVQSSFEQRLLAAIPRARITHRLTWAYGGVTAMVPESRVVDVRRMSGVVSVTRDRLLQPDTDRSPQFIGAPSTWAQLGGQDDAGEGVIVGVLDTGVWPEHPSYSDPDPAGEAYDAPPPAPDGGRACEFTGGANPGDPFSCNNKLIGADRFMDTYELAVGLTPEEFTTARDDDGHGTHTSSTAAGNREVQAEIFGVPRGIISGIAPRAHVMMYKVCGIEGCFSSDSAAAVDEAIQDGVDVINFSISGGEDPYNDPVSLAFLDAYAAGVFVSASAGNSGPGADTVAHREPWVTTVGASTTDRAFTTQVTVTSSTASDLTFEGASITNGIETPTDLVYAGDTPYEDPTCEDPVDDDAFAGKVVICIRGGNGRAEKGYNVLGRGAAGMILSNQDPAVTDLETDNHWLPAAHIQYEDGLALLDYYAANPDAEASWPAGSADSAQGDVMASFSSRGGPGQTLGISKPDVTAPGVQILAGASPEHIGIAGGPPGELFQAIAGTSMSSPHVAGAAALLHDLYPGWQPGRIKSALMTTAYQRVFKEDGATRTDPFDDGSGRIDLRRAYNPGLTFSTSAQAYATQPESLETTNYPSIYLPDMPGIMTLTKRAKSELSHRASWSTRVKAPEDLDIRLPSRIRIGAGATESFDIRIDASTVPVGEVRHGLIIFKSGGVKARMPVTIVRGEGALSVDKECEPSNVPLGSRTECTISVTNDTFDDATFALRDRLPTELRIKPNSIDGATLARNGVFAFGGLAGGDPPDVMVEEGTFDGYFSLEGTDPLEIALGDEEAANLTLAGSGLTFSFTGASYDTIGVVSNGYGVVGGASGEDIQFISFSPLPDPAPPNSVLAPYWTDLNPEAGGNIWANILCDGADLATANCWLVVEWNDMPEFSNPMNTHTFQIWLGLEQDVSPDEDITFEYDAQTGNGDLGSLTVGAENQFGNRGETVYFDGNPAENLPADGDQWRVVTTAGTAGETAEVSFRARGVDRGRWLNCAQVRSSALAGSAVDCEAGRVSRP